LELVALEDDRRYFPPYDAVPIVRKATMDQFPALRGALAEMAGKISAADIRQMNYAVDGMHREPAAVVREFRTAKGL
jgi:osmoprotectant transport system substrate-binding protein